MLILCHNYYNVSPLNKNNKDAVHTGSKKSYIFGLFLLFVVNVLWVISAEITKYIYDTLDLKNPFLISYARCSMLFVYLLVLCFSPPSKDPCQSNDYTQLLETSNDGEEDNFFNEASNANSNNSSLGDSTFVPVRAADATDSDDAAPRAVRFNKVAEVRVMSASQAGEALLARLSWAASVRASELSQRRAAAAATRRHCRLAALFLLPWFAANYLHSLSLLHMSGAAAGAWLASASAWALALGAACGRAPADRLDWDKALSVALTAAGLVVLCTLDHSTSWAGAAAGGGAGLCYAAHLAVFRREMSRSEGINAPLVAGLVGCACLATLWSVGALLSRAGAEPARVPPAAACVWLLLDACAGPALCEALWLWGTSLTSARAGTHSVLASLALAAAAARGPAAAAAALAGAGWAAARGRGVRWAAAALASLWARRVSRNIQDLDEQSEALMSSEEAT